MKKKLVIEFSEQWLKAVYFSSTGIKHSSIEKIISEPLKTDSFNLSGSISNIFKQLGQKKGVEVSVILSRNKITVRQLDLPSRDPAEIESMLALHVIRQVPYPKEEIVWSHQNLGFDGISNSHILLAVAHREILRNIFNAFTMLNILPESMLMSSQGVIHYLNETVKDKSHLREAFLILDIDYNFSDLILVNNQILRSSVIISQGYDQLKSEQERQKFCAELKQALVVFNNEIANTKPSRLFITGAFYELEPLMEDCLKRDFNLKFQFIKSTEPDKFHVKNAEGVSFASVLGFTYQRNKEDINFTLPEAQIKREIKLKLQQIITLGACLTYIFIILGAMSLVRINQLQSYKDKLERRITQLKKETGKVYDIAQKIGIVRKFYGAKQSVVTYIYELTRLCPDNITLTNFNWEWQKNFSIRGYAQQITDVSGFVNALNNSAFFKGSQARYMRRRKNRDKEIVDFEIAIK
jgi:Tfp pilus assembly PilM family ATPase/Tfp pilus assembly protein PilN